ncbi:MAG: HIT domain-containing protein [Chloroflexi bacterium]|nr:HIT domain-containing protein [Chloroflexota bacterium]
MEYLWTPWRMTYISGASGATAENDKTPPQASNSAGDHAEAAEELALPGGEGTECVFCGRMRLPESDDRAKLILLRGSHNFVILNLYPYNSAHLMVVPYLHTADFAGLDAGTTSELMRLVQRMLSVITAEYKPEGYNTGMNLGRVAGAGVADHVHMHIVPRWAGDTNFMPVVGATKVMPELLETTYDRLKARLQITS